MSLFVLDTYGDDKLFEEDQKANETSICAKSPKSLLKTGDDSEIDSNDSDSCSERDYGGLPPPSEDISHIINKHINTQSNNSNDKLSSEKQRFLNFVESMGFKKDGNSKTVDIKQDLDQINPKNHNSEILLSKLKTIERCPDTFELIGRSRAKKHKKIEREKSKGSNWFNMPATEITEELENDLKILQMRSVLNPKHFYKKNDLKVLPKYFQIGTVQHSPLEFYNERHIRKNKKKTIVDELLADVDVKKYTKRKYQEIMEKKQRYNYKKAVKKMKKLKKKK